MLLLYYFNWSGSPEEFKEYAGRMKGIINEAEGIEFSGFFVPISEWHYVLVTKAEGYEKFLQAMKTYFEKFGWSKTSLAKLEILHTFAELGLKE